MRFVVTGASGHLGARLTSLLIERGHDVLAVVRQTTDMSRLADVSEHIAVARAGLEDMYAAAEAIKAFRPEIAVHLGWIGVGAAHRDSDAQLTTNVVGTLDFFRIVRDAGCSAFVGLGSQAEFGSYGIPLTEDLPVWPRTAYGVAKLSCGLLTAKLSELAGMRQAWIRLVATYGPADDTRHLIPAVALSLLNGEMPRLSPGEQLCDYLYVDDAAEAVMMVGESATASGTFVLGSGQVHSVREICGTIRDYIDPSAELDFGAVPYRLDQAMHLQADIRRIQAATGWEPRTWLTEGLARTVDYFRAKGETT